MSTSAPADYEDIDEAEEEALLKSDDENDGTKAKAALRLPPPPPTTADDDSLMNEAAQLDSIADVAEKEVLLEEYGLIEEDEMNAEEKKDSTDIDDDVDNDNDDDDDDDEMDETDKVLAEFKTIEQELEKNQYAYDKYLRLCELSHLTDDLDYIRKAYNLFAKVYPLAPELWLKYLRIETTVALSTIEIEKVLEIFRRALRDYYSIEVALELVTLAERCADPESIWHEVLGTYGLHCLQGQQFFKLYREYNASHATKSADEKQSAYIASFLQELKYPLLNMEESYIEFKVFYEKNKVQLGADLDWSLLDRNYYKAKEHLQKILPYEDQLAALESKKYRERATVYASYITESDKYLNENILQTVYERMVADCCLNVDCWLTYIEFIDYRDEYGRPAELQQELPVFQQDALQVNNRALRNCSWSEQLYIKRIHLLEKLEKTRDEIQEVLESSLAAGFQTAEPAVAIWLEYLTYLRRHTDWQNEGECDILRKNFNLCWTILGQQWGVLADCNCEILQFWGRLEYGPLQDAKRGKELWTTVMESSDNASKSALWIEFIQLEMRRDLESTRKLFSKALHAPHLDNAMVIAAAWQRFERCNGSMKSLQQCTKQCNKYLQELRATTASTSIAKPHAVATTSKVVTKRRKSQNTAEVPEKKAKTMDGGGKVATKHANSVASSQSQRHETAFKEHENQDIDLTKDHLRIFLSNLDYNLDEEEIRKGLPELNITRVDLIRSGNGRSRGFGYLELQSVADVEKALAMDRRALNGRPLFVSSVLRDKEKRQKFKYSDGLEPKKLFLKSLPQDTTKEELEQIYVAFGKLSDVRLVYHKSGKFKNIAYVEYVDDHSAGKAVMKTDQMELRGHIISVAISAPPPKPTNSTSQLHPTKMLGMSAKRTKAFDQKPRMSLIPNVVRKKLTTTVGSATLGTTQTNAAANGGAAAKTNEDFRKLLQK